MKYDTFEALMLACREEVDRSIKQDKAIQEALGGDSYVITDSPLVDSVLDSIGLEYPGDYTVDNLCQHVYEDCTTFFYNDVEYKDSIWNQWLWLEDRIDEMEKADDK